MPEIIHGLASQLRLRDYTKSSLGIEWDKIEVGDGVEIDILDHVTARVAASRYGKRLNRRFRTVKRKDKCFVVRMA